MKHKKQQCIAKKIAKSRDTCAVQATSVSATMCISISASAFCQTWPALHQNNVFASSNSGISRHAKNAVVCNRNLRSQLSMLLVATGLLYNNKRTCTAKLQANAAASLRVKWHHEQQKEAAAASCGCSYSSSSINSHQKMYVIKGCIAIAD